MSSEWNPFLHARQFDINVGDTKDPRIGSTRNGSEDSGTLSTTSGPKSASLPALGATFIPVVIYATVCIVIFIILRRKCARVYSPRAMPDLRKPHTTITPLPSGWFNWVKPFFKQSDTFVLNHGNIDGFFFLRFLKILRNIFLIGICITWPILMPIHATGGNGLTQLDLLTLGNVAKGRSFFAHVVVAYLFFGFVLYTVTRECIYYVNIRQAYLSSPHYAKRLSSRTVLLTSVPKPYLDEARLRKLYGDAVKRIWIPRTAKALAKLVEEREQTALRLEKAEIELIKKANAARHKQLRLRPPVSTSSSTEGCTNDSRESATVTRNTSHNASRESVTTTGHESVHHEINGTRRVAVNVEDTEMGQGYKFEGTQISQRPGDSPVIGEKLEDPDYVHPYGLNPDLPDVRGSVAAQWLPASARPHHRPIGNFGRRVDTIRWTRTRLKELNLQIYKMRRQVKRGDGDALPAAFVEFETQEAAQAAHQVVAHHRPIQMSPRILGVRPDEVVWSSLRIKWWERIMRRFAIMGLITVAIIFWSLPCGFIGMVSNIQFLAEKVPFLKWILKLPKPILGFLQGFVPAMALSWFMALVPWMLRICGRAAGIPSHVLIELFTQKAYFAFQVIQVFLVTTLTSAASGALTDILKDPMSAKDLLAANLPKSSNFYLSYILIQCVVNGSTGLLHVFELIRHEAFSRIATVPRKRFDVWYNLRPPRWGGVFPVFSNMAVIAFSYSCIAPLVLLFACGGMAFTRMIYRYNVMYVFDSEMDSKGLFYPQALLHLLVGLYMAEICLVGLFALKLAFVPVVFMLIFFVFTGLVHISLSDAIGPLLLNLPQSLPLEEDIQHEDQVAVNATLQAALDAEATPSGGANDYYDLNQNFGEEEPEFPEEEEEDHTGPQNDRALEGASGIKSAVGEWLKTSTNAKMDEVAEKIGFTKLLNKVTPILGLEQKPGEPPGFLHRWLHPEIYEDFVALRKMIPFDALPNREYEEDEALANYWPPELWLPKPILWIPRDEARVSRQEVAHTKKVTPITDLGVVLDEKGMLQVDLHAAPFKKTRLLY